MSIFVAELGFEGHEEYPLMARTGILVTSFIMGVAGFIWLYLVKIYKIICTVYSTACPINVRF